MNLMPLVATVFGLTLSVLLGCRSRSLNESDLGSAQSRNDMEDKIGLEDQAWLEIETQLISSGLNSAPPYNFEGINGKTCKAAFANSTLSDKDQASLVGLLHYLESQKLRVQQDRSVAIHDKKEASLRCINADKIKTPFLGIVNGIFRENPEVISKTEKKRKQEIAASLLQSANVCVLKHSLLILRIEDMISYYVDAYHASIEEPQQNPHALTQKNSAQEYKKKLRTLANIQLANLTSIVEVAGKHFSLEFQKFIALMPLVKAVLQTEIDIRKAINQNKLLAEDIPAPNESVKFDNWKGMETPAQSVFNNNADYYGGLMKAAAESARSAIVSYNNFARSVGDSEQGPGTTDSTSELIARCSLFLATLKN